MKQLIIVLISIGCALFSLAQDQPKAVADLVSKRDKALKKANEAFMVKVVKLQSTYSKNGDVESAKKLADLINDSAGKDYKSYPSAARGFAATRDRDFKRINEIFIRELVKLQSKYTASGDFENAKKVAALISDSVVKAGERSSEMLFSSLTVSSEIAISAHELKSGVNRLSGYNARFRKVDDKLKNADFVRVPWQSNPKMNVTFAKSGYFYLGAWGEISIVGENIKKVKTKAVVTGSWLGGGWRFYKITGNEGDVAICQGGECLLIAQDITISKE